MGVHKDIFVDFLLLEQNTLRDFENLRICMMAYFKHFNVFRKINSKFISCL